MEVEIFTLEPSDWVPNNQRLPVIVYRSALPGPDAATAFEQAFAAHGWKGIWRNGVYGYHHYHTGAHEVLGVAKGSATLLIGGPTGRELTVTAGDCLLLPAGTGHKKLRAEVEFVVVGAYPPGQEADIQTSAPSKDQFDTIAGLPIPRSDPVAGESGPLSGAWK